MTSPTTPPRYSQQAKDTVSLGLSTVAATAIQAVTTFGLTKLISTGDFGAWREFVLCAGFTGVLHFGFADGLQVAWCSRSRRVAPSIPFAMGTLLAIQTCWLVVGAVISLTFPELESFPFFFGAVALYALVWNISTALQFRAQCREQFGKLSLFTVAFPTIFLACAAALLATHSATAFNLALAYCLSTLSATATLLGNSHPEEIPNADGTSPTRWELVRLGLPILTLNFAALGMANFDKAAASILFAADTFAMYGFASVIVALINSLIAAGSRVVLPHFARHASQGTLESAVVVSTMSVLVVWATALLGYFPAVVLIVRFLPHYAEALPITRAFFVATLLLAIPQIVHLNACRTLGIARAYLTWTWTLLLPAFAAALVFGRTIGLRGLSQLSVVTALAWTLCGILLLKQHGLTAYNRRLTLASVGCGSVFLLLASSSLHPAVAGIAYAGAALPMIVWLVMAPAEATVGDKP